MQSDTAQEELAFAGAARQAELLRRGQVSPRELVELHLRRIERLDPRLNAFRIVLAERALVEAQQAEARLRAGDERPLLGVPIALKDSVDLAGELTMHGTDCFDQPAAADTEMVRRLRAAGAIVIGKTHLPELAIHGFTESATWGVSRNPWNRERGPGGSSGGSGAAVAAGLAPLATASDGAGSIRIPAASCGVFGLKPQRGRIDLSPDLEQWHGMSVNGCISRTVHDTALFLDLTSGGSREQGAPPPPPRPFVEQAAADPGRMRIAFSTKPPREIAPPKVGSEPKRAVAETADLLRSLGHEVSRSDPDWGSMGDEALVRYLRGIADDFRQVPHPERLERRTRSYARLGGLYPDSVLARAREAAVRGHERIRALFEAFDVLITPVMGGTALPLRRFEGRGAIWTLVGEGRYYPFTGLWNHLGNPAAAVPAGFAADGLPLAVQLIGRPNDEGTLLSLAAQLEAERPWAGRRPPIS
jgi:amidase